MSIEAMKQALSALEAEISTEWTCNSYHPSIYPAMEALRTAIQQAEAKTDEPVAWVVMNGLSKYQVCGSKDPADALCAEMQKRHDLSGSLAAFHVQPLYTHPAPGVPDGVARDAERYRWLRKSLPAGQGSLTVLLDDRCNGAFHKAVFMESLDAAIDAAMLASPAQKGGE